jgi:hypothetical protein
MVGFFARSIGAMAFFCSVVLGSNQAFALSSNSRLELTLAGGESIDGWFVRADAKAVIVSTPGQLDTTRIPTGLVVSVRQNGERMALQVFLDELQDAHRSLTEWLADPPAHPPPAIVAAMSAIVPGTGQAALGEWGRGGGYLAADLTLLGLGGLEYATERRFGMLVSLAAIDLVIRAVSASDAARLSARRRRKLYAARARL